MNKIIVGTLVVLLAGCGTTDRSQRHTDTLRQTQYQRTERTLQMTFPEIQQALFKHERHCGHAPVFTMKEGEASLATITEADIDDTPWNQRILVDLMWLEPSIRQETRTRAHVYSFFSNKEIKTRIRNIFNAIERPEDCPSAT
ncbi:MAG TPA: hypothetical protein VK104_07615 [Burkholderiaceae bacterium]|nr:hypothetical protein [Burkholderiaceae bacterium]